MASGKFPEMLCLSNVEQIEEVIDSILLKVSRPCYTVIQALDFF